MLLPSGIFICSTPNALITASDKNGHPENPFHVKEYDPVGFRELLAQYFGTIQVTGQHPTAALRLGIASLFCGPIPLCGSVG